MVSVWDEILNRVETKVNRHSFYTWFRPTSFLKDSGEVITVRVPNPLFKDWLRKHYSGVLSEALADIERADTELEFVTEDTIAPTEGTPLVSPALLLLQRAESQWRCARFPSSISAHPWQSSLPPPW